MTQRFFWGHNLADYKEMFDLTPPMLTGKILEYGCGPTAVNKELHDNEQSCLSLDPLFALDLETLTIKVGLIFEQMQQEVAAEKAHYDFSKAGSLANLIQHREAGINGFLNDYKQGKKAHRYRSIQTIALPFKDFNFDLALSSHYLFCGLEGQDSDFHIQVIKELARVAKEVRIFPLMDNHAEPSAFLGPLLLQLQQENYGTEVRAVPYPLHKSGNAMLRIWAQECKLS